MLDAKPTHSPDPWEVIDHQEAAAQEILAQPRRLAVVKIPAADLDGVDPRIVEQLLVHRVHELPAVGSVR